MKAIILARVSTEEQKEAGNSLPAQVFRLEKYVTDKGLEVSKDLTFVFDETAYKTKRKEFSKVIEFIKNAKEPMALCCDKIDRLIRNFTHDLILLEDLRHEGKLELHFPSDNIILHKNSPASDLFRFTMGVSLAKYYSDAISDNVKRGNEQRLRQGKWNGHAPLGYKNKRDEDGKTTVVPDPEKADPIKKMFEFYATGNCSMHTLSKRLAELGLLSGTGKPLSVGHIEHTLKNPFYYGVMEKGGKQYPHNYEPLISYHLFLKCQKVRQSWNKKPFQYAAKPFIFRGLAVCDECGCTITPEIKKGKFIYYSCTNYRGKCKRLYVPEKSFLEPVSAFIRQLELPQDGIDYVVSNLKTTNAAEQDFYRSTIAHLQTEYNRYDERISKLLDEKFDQRITTEMYDKKLKEYKTKQADLLQQMQEHSKADENYHLSAAKILDICKRAVQIFESSEPNEKRQFLNFILQNCRLEAKKPVFKLKPVFAGIVLAHKTHDWQGR